MLAGVPDFVGRENHLGPVGGGSLNLDMFHFPAAAADKVVTLVPVDVFDVQALAVKLSRRPHRAALDGHLDDLVHLESLAGPPASGLACRLRYCFLDLPGFR